MNVLYLHIPDRSVPFEETLGALDKAHKAGKFKELGLSNYEPDEVFTTPIFPVLSTHAPKPRYTNPPNPLSPLL